QNLADGNIENPIIFTTNSSAGDFDNFGFCMNTYDGQTRIFRSKKLFDGSQTGCSGSVPILQAESIREKLNNKSAQGIQFNKSKLTTEIEGGTCTAMSLKFLSSYFKVKKTCKENPGYKPQTLLDGLLNIGYKFAASSEKMKARQAAYDTIEIKEFDCNIDYSKNKIQSLVNDRSLTINYVSQEIEVNYASEETISQQVDALPEGVFLLRIIKPDNSAKLEEHGHSFVYIKEEGIGLFYDPNLGAINLSQKEHSDILSTCMLNYLKEFQINKARFHGVQPDIIIS
ncbi:MAG TPA: hypothetical protein VIH61_05465, partial [Waddliaceae bacterium]